MSSLDENFGEWLQIVIPSFSAEDRDNRLTAIRAFAQNVNKSDIVPLILVFYQSVLAGPVPDRMRAAIREIDPTFGAKNEAELSVFAAGVLFELLEQGASLASHTSLAIECAEFGGLRGTARIDQVVQRAKQYLLDEGTRIREKNVKLPHLAELLDVAVEEPEEDEEAVGTATEDTIDAALRRVVKVLGEYASTVNRTVESIESRRSEESNILYWLLSGRRRIEDQLLKQLKRQNAVLYVAFELAELTRQIPGPAASSVILLSLLEQCKDAAGEATIEECISPVDAKDGLRFLSKLRSIDPLLTPLTYALEKTKENGWKKGWQTAFETQTKVPPSEKRNMLTLAEQFYREALFVRAMEAN